MNRRKIENIIAICILTVFMGQIYINPFTFVFRLSFAVVALSLFLIYFSEYNEILISTSVGVLMLLFRSFMAYVQSDLISFSEAFMLYLPVLAFYIPYGILFNLLEVKKKLHKPIPFFLSLWLCDSTPNLFEIILRKTWLTSPFDKVVLAIILMGAIRSLFTYMIFWISFYYVKRFKNDEKEKYFRELILFTAKLKTELFFLKKSKQDIEEAMALSHKLYERSTDSSTKPELLKIAKGIHEVKKDYSRVIDGMEATLKSESVMQYMSIYDILNLIRDNGLKIASSKGKHIDISIYHNRIFTTKEFYPLISILNNLVINAIDAIDKFGSIDIKLTSNDEYVEISVKDDGIGIENDDINSVFDPGYSTKYDPITGNMSTGIGLTHVKQIVENHLNGTISLYSEKNQGSEFVISIPRYQIMEGA